MALTDSEINDLVVGTLQDLGKLKFTQAAQTITNFEVMGKLLKKDKMQIEDGRGIRRTLMLSQSNSARHVGLYEPDEPNVQDVLVTLEAPWRRLTNHYVYERRELLENSGAARIVDLLKVRRTDCMIGLAEKMETVFWGKPTDSTDETLPFGIPYWVVFTSPGTAGHNGGDPSGFTSGPGGVDSDTYTNWKNYNAAYTSITKPDLIKKMRTAHRKIDFKSPVADSDYRKGNGEDFRIYTNETVISGLEDLLEAQNDNLGTDLGKMDGGQASFRRNPIVYVPKLDANTYQTDPVYMLNMSFIYPVCLKGDYLRETEPEKVSGYHNVFAIYVDLSWNILCTDRRRQAVLATA